MAPSSAAGSYSPRSSRSPMRPKNPWGMDPQPSGPRLPQRTPSAQDLGFDEQFYQPDLYRHDESEEAAYLLPYATVQEAEFNLELVLHGPFSFVQANWFLLLSGCLVTLNMTALYIEFADGELYDWAQLSMANEFCLAFYCSEVALRLAHFKRWFFYHRLDGKWNLFDLIIVATGVLDQWVLPKVREEEAKLVPDFLLPVFRAIRIFRLLRLVKLVGVLIRSDFRWTESGAFNSVVSAVIMLSIVIMGLETDIESSIWEPVDSLILVFFTFELAVKLRRHGLGFFVSEDWLWNCLDFFIVLFGVVDEWVLNLWMQLARSEQHIDEMADLLLLFRLLRLLRILRLLRLVKAIRPLYMLALGMVEAMQSMFWVLMLTLIALYTSAILMTRIIGHGEGLDDPSQIPAITRKLFETVPESMFTLFVMMNGEDWPKVLPLLDKYPAMKVAFIIFTVFSSWALLSVMTGVVSDNMISAREAQNQKDDALQGDRRARIERALNEIFLAADAGGGTGCLRRDRYNELLDIPYHARKLQGVVPQLPLKDIRDVFEWLDVDDTGEVKYQEMLRGFLTLAEPITGKALLQVDVDVKTRFRELHQQVGALGKEVEELGHCAKKHHEDLLDVLDEMDTFEVPPRCQSGSSFRGGYGSS